MRKRRLAGPILQILACATMLACSAQKPPKTQIVWQKTDGTIATREELEAAGKACADETKASGKEGTGRFAHIEWSVSMIDCMKRRGYERVEKPLP